MNHANPCNDATVAAADALSGHTIVCGLGNVGYRILRLLMRMDERGVVITRDAPDDWRQIAQPRFRVILGDAREDRLLCQAGIERARAILIVTDDDLANVSIALDARRLNPNIAITVRLFDQKLASHFEKSMRINRALSASALAAPVFTAATLGASIRGAFEADGVNWIVQDDENTAAAAPKTIGRWMSEVDGAALALQRGAAITLRPAAETVLQPGDRLTFLRPSQHREHAPPLARSIPGLAALRSVAVGLRDWWVDSPSALRWGLLLLVMVIVFSVGVFHATMNMPLADALYFVITTITTVGYGDYSLKDAPLGIKLYGIFLMLCGAAILATLFSIVTDLVLQTRLRDLFARSSIRSRGHVIVVGLGNIGFRLVKDLLRHGCAVVAIERREDAEYVQAARESIPVVIGNAKTEETLHKAGAAHARAVVAVTDDDLANLSIGLAAKRARADCRVVLRIFDSQLAEKMQHGLGVDGVLSISGAAAPTFVGSVLCPDVLQGFVLGDHLILLYHRMQKADGSDLAANEATLQASRDGNRVLGMRWQRLDRADRP